MSNQNDDLDLDDQLYILLASMKEYREAIADDNKRLETFYNEVASGVLNKAEKSLENANKKHTGALNNSIQHLNQVTAKLNAKFILFLPVLLWLWFSYCFWLYFCMFQALMKFNSAEQIRKH